MHIGVLSNTSVSQRSLLAQLLRDTPPSTCEQHEATGKSLLHSPYIFRTIVTVIVHHFSG